MSFFKHFDWSLKSIAKVIGMVLLGAFALTIVIALISFSFRTVFQPTRYNEKLYYDDFGRGGAVESFAEPMLVRSKIGLPPIPEPGYSTGEDAEAFEVKTYNATIQTGKLEEACKTVADLKSREDVIFETFNQNDDGCNFRFKVKRENTEEILKIIEKLNPEDLNENIQTIKGTIEAYDNQLDILEKKLASIEETLEGAQQAYDEVSDLATRKQDVESLALIISNKLELIEKLTNERLNIRQQIDRYNQDKADQLDRLDFSFFNINIFKDLIFDWKQIKDSWKFELKAFVRNFNEVIQGISVNLLTYMIRFFQVAIYFFISLFLIKVVWTTTKRVWKGKKRR